MLGPNYAARLTREHDVIFTKATTTSVVRINLI